MNPSKIVHIICLISIYMGHLALIFISHEVRISFTTTILKFSDFMTEACYINVYATHTHLYKYFKR